MVDAKIFKNMALVKSDVDLRNAVNKSLISCELQDLYGQLVASDPVFVVDIRSRKGTDGGAEYCAEIADAIRIILDDGFTGAEVMKIQGIVAFDKNLAAFRCRMEVFCHVKVSYTLSLTPSVASPQAAASEIIFIAAATPSQGLEYRFLVTGPGTGFVARDMTGWQTRNSFSWRSRDQDVGASIITVQVRGGISKGAADQSTTVNYTITATSPGIGTGPEITSLTPSLASPQVELTKIDFICVATDADNDNLYYRFFLAGPGTASVKKLVQDWSHKNAWQWQPLTVDVGSSIIETQIRDGLHAVEGSYDDSETLSYTVTAASGTGMGTEPTISSLTPSLASSQPAGTLIDFICIASDMEEDPVQYRFFMTGPGTASKKKMVQDWTRKNSWEWNPRADDVGSNTIEVQIRDGNHASLGSYDDSETVSYTITATDTGEGNKPAITSLTPSLSSPRGQGTELDFICIAGDVDSDAILQRFFLTGPATAFKKKLVQDWSRKNAWQWTPGAVDIGNNTIEVQVRDGNNAGEGGYDATTNIIFAVSSNTAPTINSVYVNEPGDPFVDDKIHVVASAADTDGDQILYKFWLYREAVGASWEQLTGWQTENWILYQLDRMDYETISIKCQVRDGKHAGEESFDAEESTMINVRRAAITSVTPSLASPKAHENTIVFSVLANKTSKIYYRIWQKGPGTGSAWRDMTGWQTKNSWSWRTLACDIGTNYVRAEVCDSAESWDDADTASRRTDITYTIT
jgi:hypothetical protein